MAAVRIRNSENEFSPWKLLCFETSLLKYVSSGKMNDELALVNVVAW